MVDASARGPWRPAGGRIRRALGVDELRRELDELRARHDAAEAQLAALLHERQQLTGNLGGSSEIPGGLADALRDRLDHALLHAEALTAEAKAATNRELAALRSTIRQIQAMAATSDEVGDTSAADMATTTRSPRHFRNPTPTFDHLYRAFEDRHRGSEAEIRDRTASDYADLLDRLPPSEHPVVDLGCGRGELVRAVAARGIPVVGVDSNLGQLVAAGDDSGEQARFVQADLFEWMDEQPDASCRAVFSLHVIEHVPIELQVRLVFEAHRILADGGVLVVETPNAQSLSTAATNFWVDPTHERPIHPLLLEFLAGEAGFVDVELRPLHPVPLAFRGDERAPELVADLNSLVFGHGDIALVAWR